MPSTTRIEGRLLRDLVERVKLKRSEPLNPPWRMPDSDIKEITAEMLQNRAQGWFTGIAKFNHIVRGQDAAHRDEDIREVVRPFVAALAPSRVDHVTVSGGEPISPPLMDLMEPHEEFQNERMWLRMKNQAKAVERIESREQAQAATPRSREKQRDVVHQAQNVTPSRGGKRRDTLERTRGATKSSSAKRSDPVDQAQSVTPSSGGKGRGAGDRARGATRSSSAKQSDPVDRVRNTTPRSGARRQGAGGRARDTTPSSVEKGLGAVSIDTDRETDHEMGGTTDG